MFLIQKFDVGSCFEYIKDLCDVDVGEMNYEGVVVFLDGDIEFDVFMMDSGMLVFFWGCNFIYRVFLNEGDKMCMLVVFVYNF